jgi:hypothetical protein
VLCWLLLLHARVDHRELVKEGMHGGNTSSHNIVPNALICSAATYAAGHCSTATGAHAACLSKSAFVCHMFAGGRGVACVQLNVVLCAVLCRPATTVQVDTKNEYDKVR